jgi:two-component system sensor histidine kinase KdpD
MAGALVALAMVTGAYQAWLGVRNPTVVGLSYLLIVLLVAAVSTLRVAVATSVLALLALNYFFMPPVGTFTLEDPQNWVALFVFLVVSVVGSRLSVIARERATLVEERQEAERMRQSAELKSALLSSLGHDLKTPLTAITVASDNLRAGWASEEQRREQLDVIVAEVARLNRLFQNIVDMARIETGAVAATREWVDPSDIVDAAIQQVKQALQNHPLDIEVHAAGSVQIDPGLTSAALAHVLENAGQYAPAGTPISVSARVDNDGLMLSVRDRGRGIAAQDLQYLFEQFFRGSDAGRRAFGTGMGLAISRGLLAAQGGRVWADNHPEGGARFTMIIPAPLRPDATVESGTS